MIQSVSFRLISEVSHIPNVAVCIELLSFQNGSIVDYCQITGNGTVFQQPIKYVIFGFDESFSSRPLVKKMMTLGTRLEVR